MGSIELGQTHSKTIPARLRFPKINENKIFVCKNRKEEKIVWFGNLLNFISLFLKIDSSL